MRSLSIFEQQLSTDHPNVATSLNNLATFYRLQGRYAEAEPLFLRSVSILQAQLPADHPLTARILSKLATLYNFQGRYQEAESLYLQALPILSAKLEESQGHFILKAESCQQRIEEQMKRMSGLHKVESHLFHPLTSAANECL